MRLIMSGYGVNFVFSITDSIYFGFFFCDIVSIFMYLNKISFQMWFLFKIVFPLKLTLHIFIFKDLNSFKMESMYIIKKMS